MDRCVQDRAVAPSSLGMPCRGDSLIDAPCRAGDALLSKLVNAAINTKPLYALMKVAAKQVYKSTAERNGVPWDATVRQLQATPQACSVASQNPCLNAIHSWVHAHAGAC